MEVENKTILIADDEKEVVNLLERGLSRKGFAVLTANDGAEAKKKILEEKIDLVILDLVMPRMDGWEVLKWMRERASLDTPVIIVSGKNEVVDAKYGYNLEADSYLVKPIDLEKLLGVIAVVTSGQRKKRQKKISKPKNNLLEKKSLISEQEKIQALINLLSQKGLITEKEFYSEIDKIRNG